MKHVELGSLIAPAKPRRAGPTAYPVLSITMRDGLVDQADKFKKRIASANTSAYKVVERYQLVVGFPIDEGVLAFQKLYQEAIVSPAYGIWTLREGAQINCEFLERYLRSPRALAYYRSKLRSTTARRRSLTDDTFLSLPVPLPPVTEQENIVKVIETAAKLRDLRAKADLRITELLPSVFDEMFTGSDYPVAALSDVCEFITKGTTPAASEIADVPDGDSIPFLKVFHITDEGTINFGDRPVYVPRQLHATALSRSKVFPGDVLMNIVGPPLGRIAIVPDLFPEWNVNQALAIFRPKKGLDSDYLLYALREPATLSRITSQAVGIRQLNLSLEQCRNITVKIPPLDVQKSFASRVADVRNLAGAQASSRTQLDALFDSLVHALFNDVPS